METRLKKFYEIKMAIVRGRLYQPERFTYHETVDTSQENKMINNDPIFVRDKPEYMSERFTERGENANNLAMTILISCISSFIVYIFCTMMLFKIYTVIHGFKNNSEP